MASELLEFPSIGDQNVYGMALNLEEDNVGVVIMGPYSHIREGDEVKRTGRIAEVPVGDALFGRSSTRWVGRSTARGPSRPTIPSDRAVCPGRCTRKSVHEPLQTGIKAIDAMTPIGRGQRAADHRRPPDR